ncbi:MAG: thermonuclease family protein, partial [bacterium]|nr:thermonuclease family protein [bacterium]
TGERDKYNRLLAYGFLEGNVNYNKLMIEQGYGHEYTYQSQPYEYQEEFMQAEDRARANKLGLWSPSTCDGNTKQPAK